ncbi:MAG: 1-acyl-sn-glycerol-3-phosphate acyltransferase [Leptospiraceae bacterium]|nr:1-acyl-sn-glycerol-3-phosphate acyltransferase [Leptospiraceae bacterium]MDW8306396.1 1-acyl-sn-glycerol-3-phosphate acyltransferase [Leptospiraceae bacterium]
MAHGDKKSANFANEQVAWGKRVAHDIRGLPEFLHRILCGYFRLETQGWENVPKKGKAIIVANHSNAMGYDAFILGYTIRNSLRRIPRIMAHGFWFGDPFREQIARSYGLFPADLKEGLNQLKRNHLVVIFPEGPDGNFKVSSAMYKLVEFNPGFVPLAIMQRAPVVPAAIIGAEESVYNLAKLDWFQDIIGSPLPLPLNIIPFPVKWKIRFLKPIDFGKYNKKDIKDPRFVKEINQNIRYRIQHEINKELKNRDIIFK